MTRTRVVAQALAAALVALLVSCAGTTTVDTASVEKNVRSTIDGPGSVKVDAVDCPRDQEAVVGKTFTCSFDLTDGSSGEITVTVRDADGTGRWDVSRPASGQAEQLILTGYEEKIGDRVTSVDCRDPLKSGTNAASACSVELANGTTRKVTVLVDGGDISWRTR